MPSNASNYKKVVKENREELLGLFDLLDFKSNPINNILKLLYSIIIVYFYPLIYFVFVSSLIYVVGLSGYFLLKFYGEPFDVIINKLVVFQNELLVGILTVLISGYFTIKIMKLKIDDPLYTFVFIILMFCLLGSIKSIFN